MSRFQYGSFHDGPDPLAAPVDAGGGVDEIGRRLLDGQSLTDAFRDMFRDGLNNRDGLRDMFRKAQQRRKELEKSGRMDGLLTDLRQLLDDALTQERAALFPDPSDDARFREAMLDTVPDEIGRAVQQLSNYDWQSPQAKQSFDQLKDRLQRDVLDQQFKNMTQSMKQMNTPESKAAMKEMMQDLNAMLEKHRQGEDASQDYEEFKEKHKDFFPDAPETLSEFIDELARQAAAMQRMMDSLNPEQRAELAEAMAEALADMGLQDEMSRLQENLKTMRPEFSWSGQQRMSGDEPLGLPDATQALAELADLESIMDQLSDSDARANLDNIDEAAVARALGRAAVDDLRAMREIQKQLEDEGFLQRDGDRLELTPKAVRRIGQTALRQVFSSLDASSRGDHSVHRTGAAGEITGMTRPWQFGDEQPIDVVKTVRNAVNRKIMSNSATLSLSAEDFEVHETETRTRAAVALLIDQSFSMVMSDTWRSAKTMALALHALAQSAYPLDALEIISFANIAQVVKPHELPDLEASYIQGTNLHHALMLAGRFLDKHHGAQRVVMVVTDGEPTAHIDDEGYSNFSWPPSDETIALTVAQVDLMTRRRVPISWFRLGDDPSLERFLDQMARRNGGRVLAASGDRLGDYVVSDYVRARGSR
ncbi:unannotated protein [freshwater metagenome]|uniref:Unannotated protein n=1 Tax=freshwater metagenome TaxID=449393 RepID=A0A6J6MRI5_9ZZZZ|nr:hypothetical protein [Actinomycetota bacterium]MSZ41284.1 hypothetical protein [Actinomycetota bacterium]